jgi:RNA polymerase sigma-70 factor (ECF subfamily)
MRVDEAMDPFEDVYRRHVAGVWAALARLGVERADLEDAVQDVFVVAHRRRDALSGGSSLRAWLLGISRRVAADHRRRLRRHRRRIDGLSRVEPEAAEPDDALWRSEGARLLQHFLATLDDGKREMFVLVELEQLTGREAARILGLNRNTAVARLRAARRAFDEYARRWQRSSSRLLAAARRAPPPEPHVQRRMLAVLLVQWGEGGGRVVPIAGARGLAGASTWKAAAIAIAIAGASLGGIGLAGAAWRSPPRAASPPPTSEPSSVSAEARGPEHDVVVDPVAPAPPAVAQRTALAEVAMISSPRVTASSPLVSRRAAQTVPTGGEPSGVDPLDAQAQALRRARLALREGEPDRALSIVTEITRAHPAGGLAMELALVRIGALCARGQRAQALGEARVLQRASPGSPVAARAGCLEPAAP